jgi:hypothetical protein
MNSFYVLRIRKACVNLSFRMLNLETTEEISIKFRTGGIHQNRSSELNFDSNRSTATPASNGAQIELSIKKWILRIKLQRNMQKYLMTCNY